MLLGGGSQFQVAHQMLHGFDRFAVAILFAQGVFLRVGRRPEGLAGPRVIDRERDFGVGLFAFRLGCDEGVPSPGRSRVVCFGRVAVAQINR